MELWFCEVGEIIGNKVSVPTLIMILCVHYNVTVKMDHYIGDINE